jgi:hypothetical protein
MPGVEAPAVTDDQPADTMAGRASSRRFRLLVEADRLVLVGVLFLTTAAALVAIGLVVPDAGALFTSDDPIETVFQAFIGATITGVTLVVTLNQLVLSQELGAVGDQRERMDAAIEFREDVESVLDEPSSPPEPSAFLRALVDRTAEHARTLGSRIADDDDFDDDCRERVETLVDAIGANADQVASELDDAEFGTFGVVSAALDFNYSWKLYRARRLVSADREHFDDEQFAALSALVDTLELFGPAREHIKTLYFQWELITLSRVILTAALPSLVVSVSMVLFVDGSDFAGSLAGVPVALLVVASAVALALVPFFVLLSYILRIATVTQRTLSIGPFTLRDTDHVDGE